MGGGRGRADPVTDRIGGRRPVIEALRSGREALRLWIADNARPSPELREILAAARARDLEPLWVDAQQVARLASFDGHQGVLLEVGERHLASLDDLLGGADAAGHDPFLVLLEHLQDPTNFGTLLRSAEAAGVDGVIYPTRGAAPLSAAAVKASAGASEHVPLARVESVGATIHDLRVRGLRLVAADQEAPQLAWEADLSGPLAVVVGSEGSGLSGATRRRCDLLVRFPMAGHVASLNAATAGALLLFEVVRQRQAARR